MVTIEYSACGCRDWLALSLGLLALVSTHPSETTFDRQTSRVIYANAVYTHQRINILSDIVADGFKGIGRVGAIHGSLFIAIYALN